MKNAGYTLTEFIVGMSLFAAAISIAVAVFIQGLKVQRTLNAEMAVNNSVNFILEQIIRAVRTGHSFCAGAVCDEAGVPLGSPKGSALRFTDREEQEIIYRVAGGELWRDEDGKSERMTSRNIFVESVTFKVLHKKICDPWRITVLLAIRPRIVRSGQEPIRVQTTVSSRILPSEVTDERFLECRV